MTFITGAAAAIIAAAVLLFIVSLFIDVRGGSKGGDYLPFKVLKRTNGDERLRDIVDYATPVNRLNYRD